MPWFKDGAHDRVFNTMLNGAVCLSDSSRYMDEILEDGRHFVRYDLAKLEELPEKAEQILSDREKWEYIVEQGSRMANRGHTWANRARFLHSEILCKIL